MTPVFVLVHSPAVGPSTWRPVAERLESAGYRARVPSLRDACDGMPPYWPRIAAAVREDLDQTPADSPVVLVAHSNAGFFLPVIRAKLVRRVVGSIFVDAALPAREGSTPLASPQMLDLLRAKAVGGVLPRWTDWWDEADVAPLFPDAATKAVVVDEQPRLPLAYFEQTVPVPEGWDHDACAYLLFSPPYEELAANARGRGWPVRHLPGGHLHQLVDPAGTARCLLELAADAGLIRE